MNELLQAIIKPIWELLVFIPMPWRAIFVLLVLMPILSWLLWRAFPWLFAQLSQVVFFFTEVLASLLLFGEYLLTKYLRKRRYKVPEAIYMFDDFLNVIVSIVNQVSQTLKKLLGYALKKRWFPRRVWFVITGIILLFTWYFRPFFGETTVAKLIDSGAILSYSFEGWVINPKWTPSSLISPSPAKFVEAYYEAINNSQYPGAWNCLSTKFQSNKSLPSGFISYVYWWENKVERVEVKKVSLEAQNGNSAIVKIRLQYFLKNHQNLSESESLRLWLVRDAKTSRWLINGTKKVR